MFSVVGCAIAQAVSRWIPTTAAARVQTRVWSSGICGGRSGRFSPSTSVSPANLHSTKFSIIIITQGRYNRSFSGRRAEWTQLGLHPPLCELKKTVVPQTCNFTLSRKGVASRVHYNMGRIGLGSYSSKVRLIFQYFNPLCEIILLFFNIKPRKVHQIT
jgi:hypothetical protein